MVKYSIIIPTYKRQKLLEQCLHSLFLSLHGSRSAEILVIDDASSGLTEALVRRLGERHSIRYLKAPHQGPGAARNRGLKKARGKIIVFLDDDCMTTPTWFLTLEGIFSKKGIKIAGGSIEDPHRGYIAAAAHLLNFSSWLPSRKLGAMSNHPGTNIAYHKELLNDHFFEDFSADEGYEDALFNYTLRKEGHALWFFPQWRVLHITEENRMFRKFLFQQGRAARGFCSGGYKVHGIVGKVLYHAPFLNLLCPRLMCVLWRCFRYGWFLQFLRCFPLLFVGEFYRGLVICECRIYKFANIFFHRKNGC